MKSNRYADMIAWQMGVSPGKLTGIDFRVKVPGATAKQKGVIARGRHSKTDNSDVIIVQELFGTDYNHGLFQYKACDYCDDVVAELADLSIGDAWLPEYIPDGGGTSLIIIRDPLLHELIKYAHEDGRIRLEDLSTGQAIASQAGGFRQRREGLAYRLYLADRTGSWRPSKRIKPSAYHFNNYRRRIYEFRVRMTECSYQAFEEALAAGDFATFQQRMEPLIEKYQALYRPTFWMRVLKGIKRRLIR
jgi:hypothetical protein